MTYTPFRLFFVADAEGLPLDDDFVMALRQTRQAAKDNLTAARMMASNSEGIYSDDDVRVFWLTDLLLMRSTASPCAHTSTAHAEEYSGA